MIPVNSINAFKQELLPLIRLSENIIFNIFKPEGLELRTRLCLGFSYLNENHFRHNFQECLNAIYTCSLKTEKSSHYLLPSHHKNISFRIDLSNSAKTFAVEFQC